MNIQSMLGKIFTAVYCTADDGKLIFENDTERYTFYHKQSCCENVSIESIVGDLSDLVGEPLTFVDESSADYEEASESGTWTFYKFATVKGWVDVRWLGESNGYYSESVNLRYEEL